MGESTEPTPLEAALREARRGLAVVGALSLFLNLLVLVLPLYMFQIFDRVLPSGHIETLVALTVAAAFALLVFGMLEVTRRQALMRIGIWLDRKLCEPVLAASVGEGLAGRANGGQALRDLAQLRGFVGSESVFPIFDAPWTLVFIAVIWLLHPWLGALALASSVLLFALALGNELVMREPLKLAGERWMAAQWRGETAVRNAEVVQAMGMLPALLRGWHSDNDQVLGQHALAGDRGAVIVGIAKFLRLFVQIGMLGLGAYLVLQGELTGGGMIAGSILLSRALAPVEQAIGAWKGLVAARAGYDRLHLLLRRHPDRGPALRLPAPAGRVSVDRLTFRTAAGSRVILKDVTFELAAGEALAVVGPSGSGKSTLCRLITGVWPPAAGSVRLDGAEVHTWERADFGRHVGYLPQEVGLFAGTVRDNIARMSDAPDEAVIDAARCAGGHEMILRLPEGYATEIGPQGTVLSGGQRQWIGLARAMFGDPCLLVLDEPNASLDQAGEAALVEAIGRLKARGTTVILVAHRPSLLVDVDKLLVMRDGAGVLFGPRDEILPRLMVQRPARAVTAVGS
jgi:ATP-binding cassette subfamily C protein/ATP-binding cassette subfamily C exporter for protease/lipase/ATP-binding cassette subfamily C protein EexD